MSLFEFNPWPKFYRCNFCAACNIMLNLTAIYRGIQCIECLLLQLSYLQQCIYNKLFWFYELVFASSSVFPYSYMRMGVTITVVDYLQLIFSVLTWCLSYLIRGDWRGNSIYTEMRSYPISSWVCWTIIKLSKRHCHTGDVQSPRYNTLSFDRGGVNILRLHRMFQKHWWALKFKSF